MTMKPDLLITLTTGKQDRGTRATLAFSWGCAALAMGQSVSIFMTMDGSIWATKNATKGVSVGGFDNLDEYLDRKRTRLNSSHTDITRMPASA